MLFCRLHHCLACKIEASGLLVQVLEEDIVRPQRLQHFTSQALANILWSFATLRWYPIRVLESISSELNSRLATLNVQACPAYTPMTRWQHHL